MNQMNQRIFSGALIRLNLWASYDSVRQYAVIVLVSLTVFFTIAVAKTPDNADDPGQLIQALSLIHI